MSLEGFVQLWCGCRRILKAKYEALSQLFRTDNERNRRALGFVRVFVSNQSGQDVVRG